jgi:methylmalonyl-CoA mutase C-terminal domain/subunit
VLVAKVGLDGHDRGAKYIVKALRNAGYDVIYTGIRRTPEQIVQAAIDEDVDVIGLSLLSGAHKELFARVAEGLDKEGVKDAILVAGGIIPEQDIPYLKSLGFRRVFTPGTPFADIAAALDEELADRDQAGCGAGRRSP